MFSSCATLLDGNKTRIKVTGTPAGANVYANGSYVGKAPEKMRIKKRSLRKTGGTVEVKMEGYESQTIKIYRKPRWGLVAADVVTGIVPLVIDIVTGNIYGVRPKKVHYELIKK
jgi:hypothetical protein